jgi:lysyl-tRNA synthetase class 1
LRFRVLERGEAREAASELDAEQRRYLAAVADRLSSDLDGEAVQDLLYAVALEQGLKPKRAFAAVYTVLLGEKSGPKAGPFVAGLPIDLVRERFYGVMEDTETVGEGR